MAQHTLFYRFGVALFIGILVGLQREHAHDVDQKLRGKTTAGVRTFSLMALAGCTAAFIADFLDMPIIFLGLVALVGGIIVIGYYITASRGAVGATTEVAAVITILAGALSFWDELALAVALGVITTALLSFKVELHGLAEQLTREDILAALKFALITAIVLPVLPNQSFWGPPFDVLNPYKIWLMVVLISGISFLGYVLIKVIGSRRGVGLTGFLGGLASSTATTLSFAQRSQKNVHLAKPFALAISLAWAVMFGRILVVVGALNLDLLRTVWIPIAATGLVALGFSAYLYLAPHADDEEDVSFANPFELGPAITFGLLYGVILLVSRAAQFYFGNTGVYISSLVSGLADVDAVTLSVTELSRSGGLDLAIAADAVVLAAMANTVTKGLIVLSSGSTALRRVFWPGLVLILVVGTTLAFLL